MDLEKIEDAIHTLYESIIDDVSEWPNSKDKLFISGHNIWKYNACIDKNNGFRAYAEGYLTAAKLLSRIVIFSERGMDTLIYPIIFSYRHYLELKFKELIRVGINITDSESNQNLEKLLSEHNLMKLWNQFKPLFLKVCGHESSFDEVQKGMESYINQIHSIDPESITFRYDRSKDYTKHNLENIDRINIYHFWHMIEKLTSLIQGIECEFYEALDYCNEMKANYYSN